MLRLLLLSLLPQAVALRELETDAETRHRIESEVELLTNAETRDLELITPASIEWRIRAWLLRRGKLTKGAREPAVGVIDTGLPFTVVRT